MKPSERIKAWKSAATIEVPQVVTYSTFYVMQPITSSNPVDTLVNWPHLKGKAAWSGVRDGDALEVARVWANDLGCPMWVVRVSPTGRHLESEVFPDNPYEIEETSGPNTSTPGFGEF